VDGYNNTQNVGFFVSEAVVNPPRPETVTVCFALWNIGIFGHVFIDATATSDAYLSVLSDELLAFRMSYNISKNPT
jgi:hypothetical protein